MGGVLDASPTATSQTAPAPEAETAPPEPMRLSPSFEEALRARYVEAQERWPGALVAFEAFRRRVCVAILVAEANATGPVGHFGRAGLAGHVGHLTNDALERCPAADVYLAVAIEEGNPRALEHFHRAHFEFIRNVSRKFALNDEDAEDVAQDVCVTIAERLSKYGGAGSLRGWLARVVPSVTRDRYRSGAEAWERSLEAMTEGEQDTGAESGSAILSDRGASAEQTRESLDRSRCHEMLAKTLSTALERLDDEQRELINYRYFKGLKGREIARIRGVKEYVVSKQIKKALARLEKRIYMAATALFNFTASEVHGCLELMD